MTFQSNCGEGLHFTAFIIIFIFIIFIKSMLRFSNGKWNANENGETMMDVYKWKLVIIHKVYE